MLTMREVVQRDDGTTGFGAKVREWNDHENVERWRERWETHVNTRLAELDIEGWQQLQRHHAELVRDGNFRGAKSAAQQMAGMAKSLERDAQLESVLGLRSRELGLEIGQQAGRSLSRDLASSIPFDHGRDIGRGMSR